MTRPLATARFFPHVVLPVLLVLSTALLAAATAPAPAAAQELVFTQDGRSILPSIRRTDGTASSPVVESPIIDPNSIVVDPAGQKVYWSEGSSTNLYSVKRANLDGSNVEIILPDAGGQSLSLDLTNQKIYWALGGFIDEIGRANLDGSSPEVVLDGSDGLADPDGVAVDPSGGKIYFTDGAVLKRANLDGTNVEPVADDTDGLSNPDDIRIAGSQIYVADRSTEQIFRGNLDGSGFGVFYEPADRPIRLAVTASHVYYTMPSAFDATIQRVDLNGQNPEDISFDDFPRGVAVDASAGTVYWTEASSLQIRRANLDGTSPQTVLASSVINVLDAAVNSNDGRIYWTDGGSSGGFDSNTSAIRRADADGSNVQTLVQADVTNPIGIAVDPTGGKVYWADRGSEEIQRADLTGSNVETLVSNLDSPSYLTLDLVNGKVYWTEDGFNEARIQRANLDGSGVEEIVPTLPGVNGIAVDPDGGKAYWVNSGDPFDGIDPKIQRANLDGSSVEDLVTTELDIPTDIVVDPPAGKMYWVDRGNPKVIRVANLDGTDAADFLRTGTNSQPNGLSLVAPGAQATQTVSSSTGSSPVVFSGTGVSIAFGTVSGSGDVTVRRYATPPSSTGGISETNVSRYRVVIRSAPGVSVGSGTQVRFAVDQFPGIEVPGDVTVYTRPSAAEGDFTAATTSLSNDGTELIADVSGFSEFVFASNNSSNPLPVELAGFEGSVRGDAAYLAWQTVSEANNAGFDVQRHTGGAWRSVGFVRGAGTTAEAATYRFVDRTLPYAADPITYRLRQVDTDGAARYTRSITLRRTAPAVELLAPYPNPARRSATVHLAVPARQAAVLHLYDVLGREVRTIINAPMQGRETIQIDVANLAEGTYFLRLQAGDDIRTQRLTIIR